MFRKLLLLDALLALLAIVLTTAARIGWLDQACAVSNTCAAVMQSDWQGLLMQPLGVAQSALVMLLLLLAWWQPKRLAAMAWVVALSLLSASQQALTVWTAGFADMPIIQTGQQWLHYLAFWTALWAYAVSNPGVERRKTTQGPAVLACLAMGLLLVQTLFGIWVTNQDAGLACSDFPRCQGAWWPHADYGAALDVFYGIATGDSAVLNVFGQQAVQVIHRLGALLSFLLLSAVMLSATAERNPKSVSRAGLFVSVLLLIEMSLGILSVRMGLAPTAVVAHSLVAALLMLPLQAVCFYSRYQLHDEAVSAPKPESVPFTEVLPDEQAEITETPAQAVVAPVAVQAPTVPAPEPVSLIARLKTQLSRTRGSLGAVLASLHIGQKANADLLETIEAQLLMADMGMETTTAIIQHLTDTLARDQLADGAVLQDVLKQKLYDMLAPCSLPLQIPAQDAPYVILVVGVNGAGKTTSIGKLAHRLQAQGLSVMLAAGDTFRAAAVEQLQAWGERNQVQVVAQHSGADSASVIFDALQSAKAKGVDVLIADTAGRLHTKSNLMDELSKIKRIMAKLDASAPHEVLLILDAGTGQNALSQAKLFHEAVQLTGIALTKLDGTAKGGVIFALANQLGLPIRFIGVGEAIDDLQDFDARTFIDALFVND